MFVCMYVCVCVCMYVCMYVVCVFVYVLCLCVVYVFGVYMCGTCIWFCVCDVCVCVMSLCVWCVYMWYVHMDVCVYVCAFMCVWCVYVWLVCVWCLPVLHVGVGVLLKIVASFSCMLAKHVINWAISLRPLKCLQRLHSWSYVITAASHLCSQWTNINLLRCLNATEKKKDWCLFKPLCWLCWGS